MFVEIKARRAESNDARDGIDQGRAKAAEGVPLVRGVLNAIRP